MGALNGELCLQVRWAGCPAESTLLSRHGTPLPLITEVLLGPQTVTAGAAYELCLSGGEARILHVSGTLPVAQASSRPDERRAAEAWVRCAVSDTGMCHYQVHVGEPGMNQPKAIHQGRIQLKMTP